MVQFYKIDDAVVLGAFGVAGEAIEPNTTDAAQEKHVPVIEVVGDTVTVKVGSVEHPSLDAHFIEFIVLVTEGGMQMKWLKPGMKPEAVFRVTDRPVAAYEYCNLHGLWMAEV